MTLNFIPLFCSDLRNLRFYSESDAAAGENFVNLAQFSIEFSLRNRDFDTETPIFRLRRLRAVHNPFSVLSYDCLVKADQSTTKPQNWAPNLLGRLERFIRATAVPNRWKNTKIFEKERRRRKFLENETENNQKISQNFDQKYLR